MSMHRRDLLKSIGGAGLLGLATPVIRAQEQFAHATRGMASPHKAGKSRVLTGVLWGVFHRYLSLL